MWVYALTGTRWGLSVANTVSRNGTVYLHAQVLDVNTGTFRYTPIGEYKIVLFSDGGYTSVEEIINIKITY